MFTLMFNYSFKSIFVISGTEAGQKGWVNSLHFKTSQICSIRLTSGLWRSQLGSSTHSSLIHAILALTLSTGVQSCCSRMEPPPHLDYKVGRMKLSKLSWYVETLSVTLTGTKWLSPASHQQTHSIVRCAPIFKLD